MKKKLVLLLAATLLVGSSAIATPTSAAINTNKIETTSEKIAVKYPSRIFVNAMDVHNLEYHGAYIDFDITNPRNKKIVINGMLGGSLGVDTSIAGRNMFFSLKLYSSQGELKKEVSLTGYDKLEKLNEINNTTFNYGDYLKLAFGTPRAFRIDGTLLNNSYPFFTSVVLNNNRFKITENGLKLVPDSATPVASSEVKECYWDNTTLPNTTLFTLNAKFGYNDQEFDRTYKQTLLLKKEDGTVVEEITGTSVPWYSIDLNSYNGSQFLFREELLEDLEDGIYSLSMKLEKNNKEIFTTDLVQNGPENSLNKYVVHKNINDTGSKTLHGKTYEFKTDNGRTGNVLLEVKNSSNGNGTTNGNTNGTTNGNGTNGNANNSIKK